MAAATVVDVWIQDSLGCSSFVGALYGFFAGASIA